MRDDSGKARAAAARAQSGREEALRLFRLVEQASRKSESSRAVPRPAGPSPHRSVFGRAGGPPDWQNSRAIAHRSVSAPAVATPRAPECDPDPAGDVSPPPSVPVRVSVSAAVRAVMPTIDPMFTVERIVEDTWPDERLPRRPKLQQRAYRSPREAEEGEW